MRSSLAKPLKNETAKFPMFEKKWKEKFQPSEN